MQNPKIAQWREEHPRLAWALDQIEKNDSYWWGRKAALTEKILSGVVRQGDLNAFWNYTFQLEGKPYKRPKKGSLFQGRLLFTSVSNSTYGVVNYNAKGWGGQLNFAETCPVQKVSWRSFDDKEAGGRVIEDTLFIPAYCDVAFEVIQVRKTWVRGIIKSVTPIGPKV